MSAVHSHRPRRLVRGIVRRLLDVAMVLVLVFAIAFAFAHAWTAFIIIPALWALAAFLFLRQRS